MKYIWEKSDFESGNNNWGLMAIEHDEVVIISGCKVTSLRDGHSWEYGNSESAANEFNKHGYIPVLAPVNPSYLVKSGIANKFNYGKGLSIN